MKLKSLRHITQSVLLCLLTVSVSCVKKTSRGDNFEASFRLTSESFSDGEEFGFVITANHSPLKVLDFKFPLKPDLVKVGEQYSFSDNTWKVAEPIEVSESQPGRLSITVEDVATGSQMSFEGLYMATRTASVSMSIDNEVSTKTRYPNIVDGDDVSVTLLSNSDFLILKQFSCEFNDGTLAVDKKFGFRNGRCKVVFQKVKVTEDMIDMVNPGVISMTFYDPDSETTMTASAEYTKMVAFEADVTLGQQAIISEEEFTLKFRSNRNAFSLTAVDGPAWFKELFYGKKNLTVGPDGYASLSVTAPVVPSSDGVLTFTLEDTNYTGRSIIVTTPYKARTNVTPDAITASNDNVILDTEEGRPYPTSETVTITPDQGSINTKYFINVLSGGNNIEVGEMSEVSEQGQMSFSITRVAEGPAQIRVYVEKDTDVYTDINVFTRYRAALKVDEKARAERIELCNQHGKVNGIGMSSYIIGFPYEITAQLVQWEGTEDISRISIDKASDVEFTKLSKDIGEFKLRLKVEANQNASYNKFYGIMKEKDSANWKQYYMGYIPSYSESKSKYIYHTENCLQKTPQEMSHQFLEESSGVHYIQESTQSTNNTLTCTAACSFMKKISGAVWEYVFCYTTSPSRAFFKFEYPDWDRISLSVYKVTYDKEKVDLRYIIYSSRIDAYRMNADADPIGYTIEAPSSSWSSLYGNGYEVVQATLFNTTGGAAQKWMAIPWWRNITFNAYMSANSIGKTSFATKYGYPFKEYDASPNAWIVKYIDN